MRVRISTDRRTLERAIDRLREHGEDILADLFQRELARAPAPARIPARRAKPRRSERVRDAAYLAFVRTLPCAAGAVGHALCWGAVDPHHAGCHPLGRKADDTTAIPLCRGHHRALTDGRLLDQRARRIFEDAAIKDTHEAWARAGGEVPS